MGITIVEEISLPGANLDFFRDIDNLFATSGADYLDCIVDWCERNKIDIELVTPLLCSNNISIAMLRRNAEDLHFLKREVRIPI